MLIIMTSLHVSFALTLFNCLTIELSVRHEKAGFVFFTSCFFMDFDTM